MNLRERTAAIRHFQPFDRLPYTCDGIFASTLHRWVKEGLPLDAIPGRKGTTFPGYTSLDKYFNCDTSIGPSLQLNFNILPPYPSEVLSQDETTVTVRDGMGIVSRYFPDQEDSMHQFLSHPVKNRNDWKDMKKRYQYTAERLPFNWGKEFITELNQSTHPITVGIEGIYWTPHNWMGAEEQMTMFYDDPDLVCDMMDTLIDLWIMVLTPVIEQVHIDCIGISEDMAYKCGSLISPDMFQRFLAPRYRRFVDFLNAHGVFDISIDCDGLIHELIPLYLDCGIHEFGPFEVVCGNDPFYIRREYGNQVIICGAFDKMAMAAGRDAIDREWKRLWPLVENGGFFPACDHAVPSDVSFDNFCYYMQQKRKYIGLE